MRAVKTDEPLINYSGPENLLVIPITSFVKKDGTVAIVDPQARLVAEAHPELPLVFGSLLSQGIPTPVFRNRDVNIMGVVDREHYASSISPELVVEGLMSVARSADDYRDFLVYLFPFGGDEALSRELLQDNINVVLLIEGEVFEGLEKLTKTKLIRCGEPAPDDTYIMLPCNYCEGGEFPHKGRGRRPKACPWGRAQRESEARVAAQEKKDASEVAGSARIPVLAPLDNPEAGDIIYYVTPGTSEEALRRKHATEYRIKSVGKETLEVVSTKKSPYRIYPTEITIGGEHYLNMYTKTGYEYVIIGPEEEIGDEDDE